MNLGENLVRSVSGSVEKAILCVKKPTPGKKRLDVFDSNTNEKIGEKLDFGMGDNNSKVKTASQLQALLAEEVRDKKNKPVWIDKKIKQAAEEKDAQLTLGKNGEEEEEKKLSFRNAIEKTVKDSGYHIIRVKYNPSKINIDARAGSFLQQGAGMNDISQSNMPPQTYMNFEIIIDEENAQDAFMFDKINNITIGSVVSDVAGAVKNAKNAEGYTVRPMVEALMGILTQPETRQAVFFWSEMVFAGEIVSIDAKYTMFTPLGNPIRAIVRFSMRQDGTVDEKDNNSYWSKAFDNLKSSANWQGMVGNVLNFG